MYRLLGPLAVILGFATLAMTWTRHLTNAIVFAELEAVALVLYIVIARWKEH